MPHVVDIALFVLKLVRQDITKKRGVVGVHLELVLLQRSTILMLLTKVQPQTTSLLEKKMISLMLFWEAQISFISGEASLSLEY